MSRGPRRNHTATFKAKMALAAVRKQRLIIARRSSLALSDACAHSLPAPPKIAEEPSAAAELTMNSLRFIMIGRHANMIDLRE